MANIFHVERTDNKITLGVTGTTIVVTPLTASRLIATDASKELESKDIIDFIAGTANQIIITDDTDGTITLSLPLGLTKFYSTDSSNYVNIGHNNTDAYFKTDDGSFIFQTDEGTNTDSLLAILGKGTGYGVLGVYDEDDAESLVLTCINEIGYIYISGSSPSFLHVQHTAHAGVKMFSSAAEGQTPELSLFGQRTGDSIRALSIGVGVDTADTASFDGLANYWFDGVLKTTGAAIIDGASVTIGKASTTTGMLILHDSNSANTITLTVPDISAGSLSFTLPATDGDNTNVLQTDGNGVLSWVAVVGADAFTVKVDAAATAGYIGVASNDGVLRVTTGLSYTDGGDFVTLGLSHLGFESLTSPTPNDRIVFWDETTSALAWLSPSTGLAISTTSLGLNLGALTEETTPDILDVVVIYDPTGGAHHKVTLDNLKALSAYISDDSESNAMLKGPGHAYKAATDGWVAGILTTTDSTSDLYLYVGTTNDPVGAGDVISWDRSSGNGDKLEATCFVAKDEYFEFTASSDTPTIWWKSIGTLSAPIDQD